VVSRLHGPDCVSLGTEGLRGIRFHSHVDRYRLSILVNDVAAGVVVAVAAAIVRGQNRKVHSVCRVGLDACRDQPEVWIPGVAHQHIRALRIPQLGRLEQERQSPRHAWEIDASLPAPVAGWGASEASFGRIVRAEGRELFVVNSLAVTIE
jgi:hypothetical protein